MIEKIEVLACGQIAYDQPSVADFVLSALQTGFMSGIVCPGKSFEETVVPLFAAARTTVLGGVHFVFEELTDGNGFFVRVSRSRKYPSNSCGCLYCTATALPPDPQNAKLFKSGIQSSTCYHKEFIHTRWNKYATPESLARQLIQSSFPCIPQFDSKARASVYQQIPWCRIESRCEARKSLLAPPESLLGL